MEKQETNFKVSKYNSAADQIQRIGELLKLAHKYAAANYFLAWNSVLDRVWVELAGDLEPNCNEEKSFLKLNFDVEKLGRLDNGNESGFKNYYKDNPSLTYKHKEVLMKKEVFLRRLQNKLGKGTAWIDEFEDDF